MVEMVYDNSWDGIPTLTDRISVSLLDYWLILTCLNTNKGVSHGKNIYFKSSYSYLEGESDKTAFIRYIIRGLRLMNGRSLAVLTRWNITQFSRRAKQIYYDVALKFLTHNVSANSVQGINLYVRGYRKLTWKLVKQNKGFMCVIYFKVPKNFNPKWNIIFKMHLNCVVKSSFYIVKTSY